MGKPKSPNPNAGSKISPRKSLKAQSPNKGGMNGKGPKTPKGTPKFTPKVVTPKKTPSTPNNTPINKNVGSAKKMKRSAEDDSATPIKKQKLQMFSGTGLLESGDKAANQNAKPSPSQNKLKNDNFKNLRGILQKGGKDSTTIKQKLQEKLEDASAHADDSSLLLNNSHIKKLLRIVPIGSSPVVGKQNNKQNNKKQQNTVPEESDDSEYDVESTLKIGKVDEEQSDDDDESVEEDNEGESDEEIDSDGQVVEEEGEEDSDDDDAPEDSDDDEDVEGWSGSEEEDAKPTQVKTVVKPAQVKVVAQQKPEPKKKQQKGKPEKSANEKPGAKKSAQNEKRYVVFVGNLPYTANKDDITEHFAKVGTVKNVRIPQSDHKKKGFGFVEFSTSAEYEKALSLNHTLLSGRRINVLYSEGRNNKKSKAKGLKMAALQNKGVLKGSVDKTKKRSQRRNKQKTGKVDE